MITVWSTSRIGTIFASFFIIVMSHWCAAASLHVLTVCARLLIECAARPSNRGSPMLHWACFTTDPIGAITLGSRLTQPKKLVWWVSNARPMEIGFQIRALISLVRVCNPAQQVCNPAQQLWVTQVTLSMLHHRPNWNHNFRFWAYTTQKTSLMGDNCPTF